MKDFYRQFIRSYDACYWYHGGVTASQLCILFALAVEPDRQWKSDLEICRYATVSDQNGKKILEKFRSKGLIDGRKLTERGRQFVGLDGEHDAGGAYLRPVEKPA